MPRARKQVTDYDTTALIEARRNTDVSQEQAARHFGFWGKNANDTFGNWERGNRPAPKKYRARFITYLWFVLNIRSLPRLRAIWQEVTEREWEWGPLSDEEVEAALQEYRAAQDANAGRVDEVLRLDADFTGRLAQIDEIVEYLEEKVASGVPALCALRGMHGVGKTQLAFKVAQRMRSRFPDGRLLLELQGETRGMARHSQPIPPTAVLQQVIRTFEPETKLPDDEATLLTHYYGVLADRRALLIADNVRNTVQVRLLLPPAGSGLIITSSSQIMLPGLRTFPVTRLPDNEAVVFLTTLCPESKSVALELAQACGNLPFALRICGSRLQVTPTTPEQFLERLRTGRLKLMVVPEADPDDPLMSVEALLGLSVDELETDLQIALRQLSVFPASFDEAAASAVIKCKYPGNEALERLYRRSMVEWHSSSGRYTLHDLMREYCLKRLVSTRPLVLRFAQHYAQITAEAARLYREEKASTKEKTNPMRGLELFDSERVNIDAALDWAQQESHAQDVHREVYEVLLSFAHALRGIGELRYENRKQRIPQVEAALSAARALNATEDEGRLLVTLGAIYFDLGDVRQAVAQYEASLKLASDAPARSWESDARSGLANAYLNLGDVTRAITNLELTLPLYQRDGDRIGEAYTLSNIGWGHLRPR